MQLLAQSGISYSGEHLTGEFVQWLLETARQPPAAMLMAEPPPGPADAESALRAAWNEMSRDPEFVKEAQQRNYTVDKALADFRRRIDAPVNAEIDKAAADMLTLDYTVHTEDDAFVHRVNGNPVLRIPHALASSEVVSANAKATLYAIYVVIDVLSVVAAAAGAYIAQAKDTLAKVMAKPLQRFLTWLGANAARAAELERLKKAGDKVGVIVKVLGWLRGSVNVKAVVDAFFSSLRWWEQAVVVIQLVASIALVVASAGSSLAVKLVQLAAAVAILLGDVVFLVGALTTKEATS